MIADYVYHFMPLRRPGREENDIKNVKLAVLKSGYFFDNPSNFNDPFDCKPNFRSDNKDQLAEDLHAQLSEVLGNVGIFCVAEELYRTLMWSHYANGHQGVALQFSTQQIRSAIKGIGIIDKVKYQNVFPKITFDGRDRLKLVERIIFTKSKRWVYEKEVRIVLPDETEKVKYLPKMPVRNIYLGCKIDSKDQAELREAFKDLPNNLFKLQPSSTKFAYYRRAIKFDSMGK